jgi:hypothetical protein
MHPKKLGRTLCTCEHGDVTTSPPDSHAECRAGIRTVSHTIEGHLAERLRLVAYRERVSESAIIEYALRRLVAGESDEELGRRLRGAGASLRRKAGIAP